MQFRKDINGLRAIAVLPIVFFHVGLNGFDGGFLGVDVFFVISGFLITTNIIKRQANGEFSLLSFYDKRARRIVPALTLTLLITLLLSFVFMLPYDLKEFGQSLVATSFGANNILLYLTSGYWSAAAEFKPLYHTWSLGVEEQYYFIIPIVFIALFKKQKILVSSVIMFCVVSFVSSYLIENKEFNFLVILTRFWELCAGSLLAIYIKNNEPIKSSFLSLSGLLLIFFSYSSPYYLSDNQALVNLIPILGTSLIVIFTRKDSLVYQVLSQKLIMIIGLSSYSIYLLHQPILAFLRLATENEVYIYKQLVFSLISIPLGYLSWRFLELPFRDKNNVSNKVFYTLVASFFIVLVSSGLLLHKSYGLQNTKLFSRFSYGNNPQRYADRAYSLASNKFSSNDKKMLIIGNSFARDFYNALEENNATNGFEVIYLFNYDANKELARSLLKDADLTLWVSSSGMTNRLKDPELLKSKAIAIKNDLKKYSNGNYYYIGTKNFGFNNNFIRQMQWDGSEDYMVDINKSSIDADKIESDIFADKYISLLNLFRIGNKVRLFTDNHRFISFDTDHITKDGAIYLGKEVLKSTPLKILTIKD